MSEYKRLTKIKATSENTFPVYDMNGNIIMDKELFDDFIKEHNRLAELEDDLESGKLIRLPCKVGDRVYIATKLWDIKEVVEAEVDCVEVTAGEKGIRYRAYLYHKYVFSNKNPNLVANRYIFFNDEFFLTKAEAEAKLKELEDDH